MSFKTTITNTLAAGSLALLVSISGIAPVSAQTPDGETPANEGVCDGLLGLTPGLYGLCVGFCEAQDCVATLTGEVTFDASCRPSSPKLLENYNKRSKQGDPPMPCINVAQDECPCWTEEELDVIADGVTNFCEADADEGEISGSDGFTRLGDRVFASRRSDPPECSYEENTPSINRFFRDKRCRSTNVYRVDRSGMHSSRALDRRPRFVT